MILILSLQIVALAQSPAVTLSPATWDFKKVVVGVTSGAKAVKLTNSGTGSLTINTITINAALSTDFQIAAGSNTCGTTLAASKSCQFAVLLNPGGICRPSVHPPHILTLF